ncbi:HxlR family transcriptional regulator [Lentzea atacamensis]|uniref:HxlR family transcriptional regulator n=2 Tax=Lentzea TaxID=165301 RepID=A0A316IC70_9PSEU|nr:HxlR family transcriptional regulator [Lentzea atacamensis]
MEYEISELGRSLAPIFHQLAEWSKHNLAVAEKARQRYDR